MVDMVVLVLKVFVSKNNKGEVKKMSSMREEIKERKQEWIKPEIKAKTGILKKFIDTVATASEGCVTT